MLTCLWHVPALALQQWLSLRLQCLAALVVTAVALLGVLQHLAMLPPLLSGGSRSADSPDNNCMHRCS